MADRSLKELVRTILGSTFALGGVTQSAPAMPVFGAPVTDLNADIPTVRADITRKDMVVRPTRPKILLRALDATNLSVVSSHRSHRSHSSHYSSASAPASAPARAPAQPKSDTAKQRTPGNPSTPLATPGAVVDTNSLGSRLLMKGMKGPDVEQLLTLLVRTKTLSVDKIPSAPLFTDDVEVAVKAFQAANGLTADGIVDFRTLLLLKTK